MYIFYKILYSSWFKWVGALAIPAVLVGLWFYAINQSKVEMEGWHKEQKEHPNDGKTTVDNYELKEVDDSNSIKWILNARRGVMDAGKGEKDVLLDGVDMKYMDAGVVKMRMTAPSGVANESTHIVNLKSDPKQRVIADGGEGKGRMEANTVELTKRNQFIANGSVNINLPGVAKVTGDKATGALEKTAELKNFKIIGHTHALIGAM
ncbi:MAG: LPS export ABC transporter periplasmic protein LptC [Candidatus Obscuribacterales bacterium]|nr:LPS export ABC transporter periplasmic protein LptC [Candidatus Obscuribacterales bacterium]